MQLTWRPLLGFSLLYPSATSQLFLSLDLSVLTFSFLWTLLDRDSSLQLFRSFVDAFLRVKDSSSRRLGFFELLEYFTGIEKLAPEDCFWMDRDHPFLGMLKLVEDPERHCPNDFPILGHLAAAEIAVMRTHTGCDKSFTSQAFSFSTFSIDRTVRHAFFFLTASKVLIRIEIYGNLGSYQSIVDSSAHDCQNPFPEIEQMVGQSACPDLELDSATVPNFSSACHPIRAGCYPTVLQIVPLGRVCATLSPIV